MSQHTAHEVAASGGQPRPDRATVADPGCAVEAEHLVKSYRVGRGQEAVRALDGLTLRVRQGEVFALLGPNGAGKSTAVKVLTTLTRPDRGDARVAGLDVRRDPGAVRRVIGLVSQRPSSAPMMTGRESVELAGRLHGLSRAVARRRAEELLHRFGLTEAADRLTKGYSGGMARKLDVAVGLVHRPSVLFLDEPTTGLDPQARSELWAEIATMAGTERMTVLLTTHYLDEADHLADRLAIVDHGRIVIEGTPDDLKSELSGDGVVVELGAAEDAELAVQRIGGVTGLRDLSVQGRVVRARADGGARTIPAVLAALDDAGIAVAAATVTRPSLDDVYLRHVGRAYEEVA
jgi:ABC-2 type transport system ATP-binding protein